MDLNPLLLSKKQSEKDIAGLIFNSLFKLDPEGQVMPDLAKSWNVTPDGKTFTIKLRESVYWHDGELLTAADINFTLSYLRNNSALQNQNDIWKNIKVFYTDSHTIIFYLPERYAPFLTHLIFPILPSHVPLENYSIINNDSVTKIVGTGSYMLININKLSATFERNPSFHFGVPKIKKVNLFFYDSLEKIINAFNDNKINAAFFGLPVNSMRLDSKEYKITKQILNQSTILYTNNLKAPFNEIHNRQLIHKVIRSENFFNALQEKSLIEIAPSGPIPPNSWAGKKINNIEAIAEVDTSQLSYTKKLRLITTSDLQMTLFANEIKDYLQQLNVNIEIFQITNNNQLLSIIEKREFDFILLNVTGKPDPDPYLAWHTSQVIYPGLNISGLNDIVIDKLIENGRTNYDRYERLKIYESFNQRFQDISPSIVISNPVYSYITKSSLIGVESMFLQNHADRLKHIYKWYYIKN
ncbi:MAG: ABC transporter substrate-binding protein [Dehalococcoidia bacterium]|nr:ABC transporter substrate-binding protein [Dehalococcoidia bacterium]